VFRRPPTSSLSPVREITSGWIGRRCRLLRRGQRERRGPRAAPVLRVPGQRGLLARLGLRAIRVRLGPLGRLVLRVRRAIRGQHRRLLVLLARLGLLVRRGRRARLGWLRLRAPQAQREKREFRAPLGLLARQAQRGQHLRWLARREQQARLARLLRLLGLPVRLAIRARRASREPPGLPAPPDPRGQRQRFPEQRGRLALPVPPQRSQAQPARRARRQPLLAPLGLPARRGHPGIRARQGCKEQPVSLERPGLRGRLVLRERRLRFRVPLARLVLPEQLQRWQVLRGQRDSPARPRRSLDLPARPDQRAPLRR